MSVIVGGSNGITYPDSTNTPAASVNALFTPYITDTTNIMSVNGKVTFTGSSGVSTPSIIINTNTYLVTISTNQTAGYCLRAKAVTAGWCQTIPLKVVINSGIIVSNSTTATPALTVTGTFAGGVTLINKGSIVGMGGAGGSGSSGGSGACGTPGSNGGNGGIAILASSAITICNVSGIIAGGGGGGGGGGSTATFGCPGGNSGGQGGGGRTGNTNSSGGGTYAAAGTGAPGAPSCQFAAGGTGGNGGTWGASGGTGTKGDSRPCFNFGPYVGGSGGKATCGAATYITWTATGTRYGTIG